MKDFGPDAPPPPGKGDGKKSPGSGGDRSPAVPGEEKRTGFPRRASGSARGRIVDFLVVPLALLVLLFDPGFPDGFINFLEAGHYLANVNGIFEGKIPFKDFFVLFGPLQVYAISGTMILLGKTVASLKLFFYLNYLLSFLAVWFLSRRVLRRRVAACLATWVCLVEVSHPFWAANWDFGRMGLGIAGLLVLLTFARERDRRWFFAAGVLSSLTLFYTLDVGLLLIFASLSLGGALLLEREGPRGRAKVGAVARLLSLYLGGGLVVAVPFLGFLAYLGGLKPYLEVSFYVLPFHHLETWGQAVPSVVEAARNAPGLRAFVGSEAFRVFLPLPLYALLGGYLLWTLIRRRWNREISFLVPLFVYGVLAYRNSFRSILGPQFQVALPPLILLVFLFLERGLDSVLSREDLRSPRFRAGRGLATLRGVSLGLAAAAAVTFFWVSPKRYYGTVQGWFWYQRFKPDLVGTYSFPVNRDRMNLVRSGVERIGGAMIPAWQEVQVRSVVEYLRMNTKEGEEIFCFPEHGLYNFLCARPAATRFYIPGMAWTTPAYRAEILEDLKSRPPRLVVVSGELSDLARSIGRTEELLPEVRTYILREYRPARQLGNITIYTRRE